MFFFENMKNKQSNLNVKAFTEILLNNFFIEEP